MLENTKKFKAVLFDLDGTLLDTLDDLADAMNITLVKMGFPAHPTDAYRYFVGDGIENEARRSLPPDRLDDETVKKCVEICRYEYGKCWAKKTKPYPGIAELLDHIIKNKIKMAVFSNKPDDFTQMMIKKLLPNWTFDVVRGAIADMPKKPDPAGAVKIASQLKIATSDFLYLGDTNTDMRTAVSAGMFAVGALWGFRKAEELLQNGAKVLVDSPLEVIKLLSQKN